MSPKLGIRKIWKKNRLQVTWPDEIDEDNHFAMASMPGNTSIAQTIIIIAVAVLFFSGMKCVNWFEDGGV